MGQVCSLLVFVTDRFFRSIQYSMLDLIHFLTRVSFIDGGDSKNFFEAKSLSTSVDISVSSFGDRNHGTFPNHNFFIT